MYFDSIPKQKRKNVLWMNFMKIQTTTEDLRREIGGQKFLEVSKLGGCWRDKADPQVSRFFLLESDDERVEFVFRHYHHVRLSTTARLTASTQRREGKSAVFYRAKNEWNKIKFLLQKYRRQLKVSPLRFSRLRNELDVEARPFDSTQRRRLKGKSSPGAVGSS